MSLNKIKHVNLAYFGDAYYGFEAEIKASEIGVLKKQGYLTKEHPDTYLTHTYSDYFYDPVIDYLNRDYRKLADIPSFDSISKVEKNSFDSYAGELNLQELGIDDLKVILDNLDKELDEIEKKHNDNLKGIYDETDEDFHKNNRRFAMPYEQIEELFKDDLNNLDATPFRDMVDKVLLFDESLYNLSTAQKYFAYCAASHEHLNGFLNFSSESQFTAEGKRVEDDDFLANKSRDLRLTNKASFESICKLISDTNSGVSTYFVYKFKTLSDMMKFLTTEMIRLGTTIKKCNHCGKYFVPLRSDSNYCSNISPKNPDKTCQEYGKYINYLDKTRHDEATKLYKQIYNAMNNKVKRMDGRNTAFNTALEEFMEEAKKWKKNIKSGEKNEEDFIVWLKNTKSDLINSTNLT